MLEVKGDFCFQVQEILAAAGREEDYIEIGLDGRWRWIIETHKMLPGGWVTLQDVYRWAIDGERLEATIRRAEEAAARTAGAQAVTILAEDYYRHFSDLGELVDWQQNGREVVAAWTPELGGLLGALLLASIETTHVHLAQSGFGRN